jgi:hypothetical protein
MPAPALPYPTEGTLSRAQRWVSLAEITVGTLIVIGHNMLHVLPNEVPILFVLFWISFRLRDGSLSVPALGQPKSWRKAILMAVAAAALLQLGSNLVIQPLAGHLWHRPEQMPSVLNVPAFDWKLALRNLAFVWIFAGFGEEVGYRGYLADADGGRR